MSTALYRRYRPQTFAEVVGQEHVTVPLQRALATGRVNHAYLFSGPRGCGKTTSARILARCLNCENGPTDTPCGECRSCRDLATGGSGSVDVIEIDAASHGGVDDARDLREKASFGPATSRYKVYIIDEAHMVTSAGFNALLKIVEEPPEHVLFIFATTEPEKVIGTIRSRTHHYPFRLVPPTVLQEYLGEVCGREGIAVEPGVLSYVVRAGGGSVRDSMSVLDQLIAGSGDEGITLAGTTALLGFTDAELLDGVVDAYAAGDGASLFTTVERVVGSGQDPRRFVEDLSERMRDLILVDAVPTGTEAVLPGVPDDQLERLRQQASGLGAAELSRASDVLFRGLAEMTGATSPRLQLEIIMARLLLPRAAGEGGFAARLEKVERWMAFRGDAAPVQQTSQQGAPAQGAPVQQEAPAHRDVAPGGDSRPSTPTSDDSTVREAEAPAPAPVQESPAPQRSEPVREAAVQRQDAAAPQQGARPEAAQQEVPPTEGRQPQRVVVSGGQERPSTPTSDDSTVEASAPQAPAAGGEAAGAGPVPVETLRHEWSQVLDRLKGISRVTWAMVSQPMQVAELSAEGLTLSTEVPPIAERFNRGDNAQRVAAAVQEALGFTPRVRCVVGGRGAAGGPGAAAGSGAGAPGPMGGPAGPSARSAPSVAAQVAPGGGGGFTGGPAGRSGGAAGPVGSPEWGQRSDAAPDWATADAPAPQVAPSAPGGGPTASGSGGPNGQGQPPASRPESVPRHPGPVGGDEPPPEEEPPPEDDFTPDLDDETVESVGVIGTAAIEKILGGTVIEEHTDQA